MADLRILIADDHDLIRRGVRDLLASRPDWHVVGEANDGAEAVGKAEALQPDVAILDLYMPVIDGVTAAAHIRTNSPGTAVLMLTMHDDEQVIRDVLQSGARGYVLKTDADQDLVTAIQAVTLKRRFFTSSVTETLLGGFLAESEAPKHSRDTQRALTAREQEVLVLLAEGMTSKQIANKFGISVRTVESHRIHINRKLGFGSVAELVRYAIRQHLIP